MPVRAVGDRMRLMVTPERPTAIRVTATSKRTALGRKKRRFRYDALYADGHVERDVNVDAALEGGHFPADAWATRDAADVACPEVGTGQWVEYATGRVLEGPPRD
jgi:prepilin-type processing-associated H-X9-DG protein